MKSYDELKKDGDAFLEHYGVKGMKWKVRKAMRRASVKGANKLEDIKTDIYNKRAKRRKSIPRASSRFAKRITDLYKREKIREDVKNRIGVGVSKGKKSTMSMQNKALKFIRTSNKKKRKKQYSKDKKLVN